MTISGFDVDAINKSGFNFATAFAQGHRACYLKLGGGNLPGNAPYVMTSYGGYVGQVSAAVSAGFKNIGSYWLTGGHDPVGAARYYIAHRDSRTNFDVLDNETLDSGNMWNDAESAAFFDVLKAAGCTNLWMYGSRIGSFGVNSWPQTIARGVKALVADYDGNASPASAVPSTYPAALVKGHQYSSSASIGGLSNIDADVFTDDAFNAPVVTKPARSKNMAIVRAKDYKWGPVFLFAPGYVRHIANPSQLASAQAGEGGLAVADQNNQGIKNESYNYSVGASLDQIIELSIRRDANGKVLGYDKGGYIIAPWLDVRTVKPASATLTDAQVTALATEVAGKIAAAPVKFKITGEADAA